MLRHSAVMCCLTASVCAAEVPNVVTDIAPIHGLVAQVMGNLGTPDLLVPTQASPHAFNLRPSQATALSEADLVFWIGEALTPWLEDSLETLAPDAQKIALLDSPGTFRIPYRTDAVFEVKEGHGPHGHEDHGHDEHGHDEHEDHAHEEGHSDGHDHAHGDAGHAEHTAEKYDHEHDHDHGHDGTDAHAWLDIENGKHWLSVIGAALSAADPQNAEAYTRNMEAAMAELNALDGAMAEQLAAVQDAPYVVFHDAYQYFEARYGLSALGALSLSDATAPSPARVAEVQAALQSNNVRCLFGEPQFNSTLAERLTDATDVRFAVLDPLGASIQPGPGFYPSLMQGMADALTACLK